MTARKDQHDDQHKSPNRSCGWVLERSLAWLSRNRRLAKDYERMVQTAEALIEVAAIRLVLRRLAYLSGQAGGQRIA
jgi:hypothetical protein